MKVKICVFKRHVGHRSHWSLSLYLDEGEFAKAGAALCVSDGDLPVVLDPPPSTEDVVHTGGDFVPLIVISKPKHIQ